MSAHAEFLRAASENEGLAVQLKRDFRKAPLAKRDRSMLDFVEKLTRTPWLMEEGDVNLLREAGFGDPEVLHVVLGCGLFNYFNRMADGLGIKFEYPTTLPGFAVPPEAPPIAPAGRPDAAREARAGREAWIRAPESIADSRAEEGGANLLGIVAANPEAQALLRAWRRYQLTDTPELDRQLRARIALFISGLNRSAYCLRSYRRFLERWKDDWGLVERLARGEAPAELPSVQRLVLEHCRRLTQEPWTVRESHLEALRRAGMDDLAILRLTMLASYLSFENRVALGLGIVPED